MKKSIIPFLLFISTFSHAITVKKSFDIATGVTGASANFAGTVVDMGCAVSPNYVACAMRQTFAVYDKNGNQLQYENMCTAVGNITGHTTTCTNLTTQGEPDEEMMVYDSLHNRWYLGTEGTQGISNDLVCVSANDDPRDPVASGGSGAPGWHCVSPSQSKLVSDVTFSTNCVAGTSAYNCGDIFTRIAYDSNGLYTTNFTNNSFGTVGSDTWIAIPINDLMWVPGGVDISTAHFSCATHTNCYTDDMPSAIPVQNINPNLTAGATAYIITRCNAGLTTCQNATNQSVAISIRGGNWSGNTFTRNPITTLTPGEVYNNIGTGQMLQPTATLGTRTTDTCAFRFCYAVQSSTVIYGAISTSTAAVTPTLTKIYFYGVDVSGTPSITTHLTLDETAQNINDYDPYVYMNSYGNPVIAHQRMSSTAGIEASIAATTFVGGQLVGPIMIYQGPGPSYTCSKNTGTLNGVTGQGWSNSAAVITDPSDPTSLWAFLEYAGDTASADCLWKVRAVNFSFYPSTISNSTFSGKVGLQ